MLLRVFLFITASFTLASSPLRAQMVAPNERVRVDVTVATRSDKQNLDKTTVDTTTSGKKFTIQLAGKARTPEDRVITWVAYGRDTTDKSIVVLASGIVPLDLSVGGKQVITTEEVQTTYTPKRTEITRYRTRDSYGEIRTQSRAQGFAAEGTKYIGYSVKVMSGNTVVGERSDPAGVGPQK